VEQTAESAARRAIRHLGLSEDLLLQAADGAPLEAVEIAREQYEAPVRENVRDHVALQSRYSKAYTKVLDHFTKGRSQATPRRSAATAGELSAYEVDRIQRMRSNQNFLAQLELDNPYQPLQE
jgi:hypothetical protein